MAEVQKSTEPSNLAVVGRLKESSVREELHGEKYVKIRKYKTESKGAQEAHEAIRPTYMSEETIGGSAQEQRLYELIWKRTIASQMADAILERTTVSISISNSPERDSSPKTFTLSLSPLPSLYESF